MAENSKIEWTHHTANLWWGCTRVHQGCDNCYAATLSNRWGKDLWDNNKRQYIKSTWGKFQKWNDAANKAGEYHRVFVGSMMDIFEKSMPVYNADSTPMTLSESTNGELTGQWETHDLRDHFFRSIVPKYPNLMFLLLTKRPSNINKYIPEEWKTNPPRNVMFGASVVDQDSAKNVSRHLSAVQGAKFLSIEPLLDQVDMSSFVSDYFGDDPIANIDWAIVGGESGHGKRPFNPLWAREIKDWCKDYGVPFFMKQWDKVKEIPEDLMIREFPKWHEFKNSYQESTI